MIGIDPFGGGGGSGLKPPQETEPITYREEGEMDRQG